MSKTEEMAPPVPAREAADPPRIDERYRIEKEIGRGGMGRVFVAHDRKLGRDVAIKMLPSGPHGEEALRRFEQEARATCALNHANILDVHDIGTHEGSPYIVSELLHGTTLRERLRGGPLPLKEASGYALQLAQGLSAAHEKGIVHRDLKPENLFITEEGRLKILDFGIAKLVAPMTPGTGETLPSPQLHTEDGAILGTVVYMSPEQVRGERADQRSDIFSAGAVLYEMLAGRQAFARHTSIGTGSAILHEEPAALPGQVPLELKRVVRRCLEKDPKDRFQSAHDLALALAAVSTSLPTRSRRWPIALAVIAAALAAAAVIERTRARPVGEGETSIAVVPFVNMSSDKENEYFSDGITEELINVLANIPGLRVVSRTSVFALKGKGLDARQIGEKLNVKTLLEGSVRREGNALRVTAQLVNVADDVHLWSQSYDRELKGIFALEDEIARSIALTLRRRLTRSESVPLVKPVTDSQEAHDLYLRGRYFKEKRNAESLRKAEVLFKEAVEKDPAYALAYVGLADAKALQEAYDIVPASTVLPDAKQAALRALELDPTISEAHASLGLMAMNQFDWPAAERELRKAIELKPDYPEAHHWYALELAFTGRRREARAEAEKAVRLDPTSLIRNNLLAVLALYDRDFRAAEDGFKRTLEMDPGFANSHSWLARLYAVEGRYAEAETETDKGVESVIDRFRGLVQALAGRRAEALRTVEEMEERAKRAYVSPAARGLTWVALGDKERGYGLLERACAEKDWRLRDAKVDPIYDSMRSDPRFKSLLKCLNLE